MFDSVLNTSLQKFVVSVLIMKAGNKISKSFLLRYPNLFTFTSVPLIIIFSEKEVINKWKVQDNDIAQVWL